MFKCGDTAYLHKTPVIVIGVETLLCSCDSVDGIIHLTLMNELVMGKVQGYVVKSRAGRIRVKPGQLSRMVAAPWSVRKSG